ncbi:hypothetical protein F7725_015605 [Dissostichus mawsoni]|uniref:Uncharacterized protein n=1 Tax=Dissostichus mawsoni TaxID=36200 RepID=A0A7J5YLD0_DISMA|nr:hypothetical protein F7725_015605 [Dissostichus mawsoni]
MVKHSFKEDRSNHDGHGESGRSPEEQIVDGLSQRHVFGGLTEAEVTRFRSKSGSIRFLTLRRHRIPTFGDEM